jgi:hypothetical protein
MSRCGIRGGASGVLKTERQARQANLRGHQSEFTDKTFYI